MQSPLYDPMELEEDRIYWVKKLGLTMNEYSKVMAERPSTYRDFPNSENGRLRRTMRVAAKIYRKVLR
jgi:hypothetical protein